MGGTHQSSGSEMSPAVVLRCAFRSGNILSYDVIEQVNYLVIESGSYKLPGGSRVEAGRFDANAVGSFAAVQFKQPFSTVPVVMATTTSVYEGDAVAMRLKI